MKQRSQIETRDARLPDKQTIDLSGGVDDVELAVVTDADVDKPWLAEYNKDLAFNEQILEFSIGRDSNPYAENPVPCGCNGVIHQLQRGKRYRLARKFVDSLIKTTFRVETEEFIDEKGLKQTRVHRIPAEAYPLSIHHDPANEDGKDVGKRWFDHQSANAV